MDPFAGLKELNTQQEAEPKGKKGKKKGEPKVEKATIADVNVVAKAADDGTHQEKAKLIYAIQAYGKNVRLGTYLRQQCCHRFDETYLKKLTLDELKLELEKQEVALGNKQNNGVIDTVLKNGLTVVETMISQRTKFQVNGTTERLYEDDHYLDLLERVKMRYSLPFVQLDPILELALVIGQTGMMVHAQNQFSSSLSENSIDLDVKVSMEDLEKMDEKPRDSPESENFDTNIR